VILHGLDSKLSWLGDLTGLGGLDQGVLSLRDGLSAEVHVESLIPLLNCLSIFCSGGHEWAARRVDVKTGSCGT